MSMHPAGRFDAEIIEHGITFATTGTEQVVVKFQTSEGTITGWFAMTEKAAEYTIEKLRNMGFAGSDLAEVNDGECLIGHRCNIVVVHETYKGEERAKVQFVNPEGSGDGGAIERSDGAAANVRKFNVLLKKRPPIAAAGEAVAKALPRRAAAHQ